MEANIVMDEAKVFNVIFTSVFLFFVFTDRGTREQVQQVQQGQETRVIEG